VRAESADPVIIRRAEPSEITALSRLWHDSWHDTHPSLVPAGLVRVRTLESFETRMTACIHAACVAGAPGDQLGFYALNGNELDLLFVAAEWRGTGVGAVLIADAELRLRESGVETAWLACVVGNERAARFYEKSGWRRVGFWIEHVKTVAGVFDVINWRDEKVLV
jgi:GNAT superfamily N-acetyltransferase